MTIECYSIDGDECILRKEYDDAPDSEKFSGKAVIYTNLPLIKKSSMKLQKINCNQSSFLTAPVDNPCLWNNSTLFEKKNYLEDLFV